MLATDEFDIKTELLGSLLFGVKNAVLNDVLQGLTEQGVRKMEKGFDSGLIAIQNFITTHFHPAAQILLFELSNLVGLARWYSFIAIFSHYFPQTQNNKANQS